MLQKLRAASTDSEQGAGISVLQPQGTDGGQRPEWAWKLSLEDSPRWLVSWFQSRETQSKETNWANLEFVTTELWNKFVLFSKHWYKVREVVEAKLFRSSYVHQATIEVCCKAYITVGFTWKVNFTAMWKVVTRK